LHYNGNRTQLEDGSHVIANEQSRARLYSIYPKDIQAESRQGYLTSNYGSVTGKGQQEREYLCLSTVHAERVHSMIHVIALNEAADDLVVEPLAGQECIGVRLTRGQSTREVWYNLRADGRRMHINSNNTLGEWDTDAYLLMKERKENHTGFFMVAGSYLRRQNDVRQASFEKTTTYLN
jgi:hypothetical protein